MYLGIDLGTSSVKTVLMDENQSIMASSTASMDVSRPDTGWSEQDPAAWISGMESTLAELHANYPKFMQAVRGIGLSGPTTRHPSISRLVWQYFISRIYCAQTCLGGKV